MKLGDSWPAGSFRATEYSFLCCSCEAVYSPAVSGLTLSSRLDNARRYSARDSPSVLFPPFFSFYWAAWLWKLRGNASRRKFGSLPPFCWSQCKESFGNWPVTTVWTRAFLTYRVHTRFYSNFFLNGGESIVDVFFADRSECFFFAWIFLNIPPSEISLPIQWYRFAWLSVWLSCFLSAILEKSLRGCVCLRVPGHFERWLS